MENLKKEIEQLKKERNAVLLAHYYVDDAVQEIADYVGDSYYLAKVALKESKDVICFAGVNFMGESAKILNPEKTVLMPDMAADCPMAHMASPETIEKVRAEYDDLAVVCYINSTAELKRHSDVCVTSANAVKIVKNLPNKNIFFIPDRNLADYIGSTTGIINYAGETDAQEMIICTESGVLYELEKRYPEKKFYFTETLPVCRNMKKVTLEKILHVLKTGENEVFVDDALREESKKPLERMLELAK